MKVKGGNRVSDEFPVDQVAGSENGSAWRKGHRGGGIVVLIALSEDIDVGKIVPQHGIGVGLLGQCTADSGQGRENR